MKILFSGTVLLTEKLASGIELLAPHYGFTPLFQDENADITVTVCHGEKDKLRVNFADSKAEIAFDKKNHFFRGLGLLLQKLQAGKTAIDICENVQFNMCGALFDVSQGSGVINIPTMQRFIRNMALMGINTLMLYCEDSFDVPEEPYFGYMRSRYSETDMRTLDDYADRFGIEMIPCIQTLAHLSEVLKWSNVYGDITDLCANLLVGEEKTYEFVRHLIEAATKPFRTKRIHIGMDEAFMLGQGKYLNKNGFRSIDELMREHLSRVMEIVRELGLEPMMWSDMFFTAPGTAQMYGDANLRQESIEAVPKDIRLVFWDYYRVRSDQFYLDYIDLHRNFCEPIFAAGISSYESYSVNWARTFNATSHGLSACRKKGVRDVFTTVWGDRDAECNVNFTLLGLAHFAENGFSNSEPSRETLRERFEFICHANYDDFMMVRHLDHLKEDEDDQLEYTNPSKVLMYQDVLCGLYDKNIEGIPYDKHYEKWAVYFDEARKRGEMLDYIMDFTYHACHTLALKATMGLRITTAYKANNRAELERIMKNDLPELKCRMTALRDSHRIAWFKTYKPLGWETFDARYGAAISRFDSAIIEIGMYLNGELETIAELEEPRLPYDGKDSPQFLNLAYSRIAFSHNLF